MMRRTIAAFVAVLAVSVASLMARQAPAGQAHAPTGQAPAPAGQAEAPAGQAATPSDDDWKPSEIKNLTVLPKDMPVDDVMKIMKAWNTALNVECVFCHVGQMGKPLSTYDFASDNKKRKDTSRIMLRMVIDANEKFKEVGADEPPTISCATCHKRSRHVEDTLPAEAPKDNH